jgi:PAS domain S-box-containing protein
MTASKGVANAGVGILIVEDSPTQAEHLRYMLEEDGYRVTAAATGAQALVAARKEKPALILSDIVMPEMDGYAFCKAVKSDDQLKNVPVILVTSLSSAGDVVKGLQCGADNFIRKPYEEKYLLARINYALTNRTLRDTEKVQIGMHISLAGEHHFITADRQQILDLLISTYEEAVHLNEDLKARKKQLTRANLTLEGLYRIAKGLNRATSQQEVVEHVMKEAMELPGVQAVWIVLQERDASFRLAGARGLPPALAAPGAMEGDCLCRRRLLSGELSQVANILECERLQKAEGDTQGLRCHASVPLWAGDRTVGLMNLVGSQDGLFSDEELQVLNGIGNQIALALERARLSEHLEAAVEDRTAALRLEINERALTEQALRISEAKFRSLFEHVIEGVHQSTGDGRLLVVNPAFVRMLGYESEAEALALDFGRDIYVDPEERVTFLRDLDEKGEVRNVEARFRRKDGRVITVVRNATVVRDEQGAPLYFEGTVLDITERKHLEEQLRQSQKIEAIGQLAGGIAHDFNNVLTMIQGYGELLIQAFDDRDPRKPDVQEIMKSADRAAALTRQLLAFSRRQILEPRILDLRAVVGDLDQMLRRLIGEDVELTILQSDDLGRVKADRSQMEQVLMNLAINARDAISAGGKLTIETMNANLDEDYARQHVAVRPGPHVLLAVSDTGSGMDAETLSHIFEPFFTTKEQGKGTGLGLSTVYGIVKQSGGNIWVYSEPGRGTTFKIYLPRVEEAVEKVEPDTAQTRPVGGSETVLLVEDEEGIRKVVCRVLRPKGYTVLEAQDPNNGLALSAAHPGPIHLLITDIVLPQMSGAALADRIVQERPGTKVLYMSGYTDNAIVHHGLLDRGKAFLPKPFSPATILRKVREVLDAPREESR